MNENEKKTGTIVILGMTREGKTTKAKELIKQYDRVVILDKDAEYDGTVFESYADFDYWIRLHCNDNAFVACCRFDSQVQDEAVIEACFWIGNVCLVAEECEAYVNPRDPDTPMNRLINRGRKRGITVIAIGRRQTELSRTVRAQGTRFISFRQNLPGDIEAMQQLGLDVGSLKPHEFCELTI